MIMKTRDSILVAMSLFIFAGCASSPKATATPGAPITGLWEYREISGFGAERSPEAAKLQQDGWVYVGTTQGGGNLAEDYAVVSQQAGPTAVFRREYR